MTGGYRDKWAEVEPALRWLERQSAPEIEAVSAEPEATYAISVPNNDLDTAARDWRAGRVYDSADLRTMKTVRPFFLPGEGPHLVYRWRAVDLGETTLTGLRIATGCLNTLGWGIDMAFAELRVGDESEGDGVRDHWRPVTQGGRFLALPTEGSLDDLRDAYRRFLLAAGKTDVNPDTRPMEFRQERYSCGTKERACIFFNLQQIDREDSYSEASERTMIVAAWLRHAAAQALLSEDYDETWVNAVALGHGDAGARISYVPMPSVGHTYADGRIRRVMLVEERGGSGDVVALLEKKLNGQILTDEHGNEKCRLVTADDETTVRPFYTKKAKDWWTVTPIVLHGYNAQRGVISLRKTERLLGQAFEQAGWDVANIENVSFQMAPLWRTLGAARDIRVPRHLKDWPRYHVAVRLRNAVQGPLLAGLGRHCGIGVFARKA